MEAVDWQARYISGDTGWDLGGAHPALERLLARGGLPAGRVLVPGAGRGHDAFAWARAGYEVLAVDFAPAAVAAMRVSSIDGAGRLDIMEADIFSLPAEHAGRFDLVWEHTCFCAIPLNMRGAYVQAMAGVLKRGGQLVGVFWNNGRADGPPFDVTVDELRRRFSACFDIEGIEVLPPGQQARAGEILAHLRRPHADAAQPGPLPGG